MNKYWNIPTLLLAMAATFALSPAVAENHFTGALHPENVSRPADALHPENAVQTFASVLRFLEKRLNACSKYDDDPYYPKPTTEDVPGCLQVAITRSNGAAKSISLSSEAVQRLRALLKSLASYQIELKKFCVDIPAPDPASVAMSKYLDKFMEEFVRDLGNEANPRLAVHEEALSRATGALFEIYRRKTELWPLYGSYPPSASNTERKLPEFTRDMAWLLELPLDGVVDAVAEAPLSTLIEEIEKPGSRGCDLAPPPSPTTTPISYTSPSSLLGNMRLEDAQIVLPDGSRVKRAKIKAGDKFAVEVPGTMNEVKPEDANTVYSANFYGVAGNSQPLLGKRSYDKDRQMFRWDFETHPRSTGGRYDNFSHSDYRLAAFGSASLGVLVRRGDSPDMTAPTVDVSKVKVFADGTELSRPYRANLGHKKITVSFPVHDEGVGFQEGVLGTMSYRFGDNSFSALLGRYVKESGRVEFDFPMEYGTLKPPGFTIVNLYGINDGIGNLADVANFEIPVTIATEEGILEDSTSPEIDPSGLTLGGKFEERDGVTRYAAGFTDPYRPNPADAFSAVLVAKDTISGLAGATLEFEHPSRGERFVVDAKLQDGIPAGEPVTLKFGAHSTSTPGYFQLKNIKVTDKFGNVTNQPPKKPLMLLVPPQYQFHHRYTPPEKDLQRERREQRE